MNDIAVKFVPPLQPRRWVGSPSFRYTKAKAKISRRIATPRTLQCRIENGGSEVWSY